MGIIQLQTATTAGPTYEGSMVRVVTAPIISALSSHPFALDPGVDIPIHPYPSLSQASQGTSAVYRGCKSNGIRLSDLSKGGIASDQISFT